MSPAVNGQGLATASAREIIRIAFAGPGLHRVQAFTLLDNLASRRVLAK